MRSFVAEVIPHPVAEVAGLKVGLLAARQMVDLLGGGCGLVVSEIAQIRHTAQSMCGCPARWLPEHKDDVEERTAATSLRQHFRRMGFER